jgi:hypothetical protein
MLLPVLDSSGLSRAADDLVQGFEERVTDVDCSSFFPVSRESIAIDTAAAPCQGGRRRRRRSRPRRCRREPRVPVGRSSPAVSGWGCTAWRPSGPPHQRSQCNGCTRVASRSATANPPPTPKPPPVCARPLGLPASGRLLGDARPGRVVRQIHPPGRRRSIRLGGAVRVGCPDRFAPALTTHPRSVRSALDLVNLIHRPRPMLVCRFAVAWPAAWRAHQRGPNAAGAAAALDAARHQPGHPPGRRPRPSRRRSRGGPRDRPAGRRRRRGCPSGRR